MKTVDYLIWGCVIIIIAIIILSWQAAYADRETVNNIESQIRQLNANITNYDGMILEKKSLLGQYQKEIISAKENFKQVKKSEGKSWDFLPSIKAAQDLVDTSVQNEKDTRIQYLKLLKEKSDAIKAVKLLEKQLVKEEKKLKVISFTGKKIIQIQLSGKCINMIKAGLNTTCPSYKDLRFLDTSRQEISGKFVDDGFYHRSNPPFVNSWRYYDHDPVQRVIVDPPGDMANRFPLIKIESNFDTYLQTESKVLKQNYEILNLTKKEDAWGRSANYTGIKFVQVPVYANSGDMILFHDRFVDVGCKNAIINSDKGMALLLDTISFMQNRCDVSATNFTNSEIITKNYTTHDISTSQKWKDEQRLKWIIQNCLTKYQACK